MLRNSTTYQLIDYNPIIEIRLEAQKVLTNWKKSKYICNFDSDLKKTDAS